MTIVRIRHLIIGQRYVNLSFQPNLGELKEFVPLPHEYNQCMD